MDPRPRISETVHCPCEVKRLGEISNDSKLRIIWVGCFSHKVYRHTASSVCTVYVLQIVTGLAR